MPNKLKKDNIRLSIEKEWPSAKAFGTILPNYMITPDSAFTRLKTGVGDIEYFNEPYINYGSEDSPNIILNPNGNIPTLLYSPLNNSLDDIKLDLLHHYRLYDPVYLELLQDYTSTLNKSEILWNSLLGDLFRNKYPNTYDKHWEEWDALVNNTPNNSLYMVLGIDGSLRNLLAKEETIKKSNYAPREEAILQYLNTPKAQQAFNTIQQYLESNRLPEVTVTPNSHADGGLMFEEEPPVSPVYPSNPTKENIERFIRDMGEYMKTKSSFDKIENLKLPNGEELQRFAGETQEDYENRYKERVDLYNLRKAEANKRFEARQQKINNIVKDITDTAGLAVETPSMPFPGEDYREAAEYERQKLVNKAHDYKNIFDATLTAAELGMSGASLLGAYANWKKWKDLASLANPTTAQLAKVRIANLLLKALLPMLIGGTGIDAYLTYDALNNDDTPNAIYNGVSMGLGALGSVGASDVFLNSRFHSPKIDRLLDVLGITLNTGDFLKLGYDTYNNLTKDDGMKATGGTLSTPLDWNELTMKEKAAYIRMGVANGYKDIDSIKEVYNEFKCGGNLYKEGGPKKQEYIYDVLPRLLKEAGLNIRVTSGYRKPGVVGTAGNRSWHPRHGAVDIVPMGKTTFEDIEEVLHTNPTIVKYMLDNGFGLLDESGRSLASRNTMKRTGATGAHFHIGRDSKPAALYKQRVALYSPMATTDNRKVYFSNPHLPIPEDLPQPKQVVSIQTPAKPLLNTTLDSNIPTDLIVMQLEEPIVDKLIPEVVVTALAPRQYVMPNPQELLDLMNSMMVPYELPEIPKPVTATERLAQLNLDRNSLLLQDLENSILRANRFGTPLDEVKLARDVKDLQFYRNMAASGGKLFEDGGPKEYIALHPLLDEVVVTAPRKYFVRYNEDGNPIYTEDYALSQEAITNSLSEDPEVARRKQAVIDIKNRPAGQLTGTAKTMADMAELGIGSALAPIAAAPLIEGIAPALQEAWNAASPYVTPYIQDALKLGLSPVSSIAEGISNYVPLAASQVSKTLPYLQAAEKTGWGLSGAMGLYNNAKDLVNGDKHWANALAEGALEGMMMTELGPVAKLGYNLAKKSYNIAEDASAASLANTPIIKRTLEAAALTADINPVHAIKNYLQLELYLGKTLPKDTKHFKETLKYIFTGKGNSKDAYFAPEGFGFERANGDKDGYLRALLYGEEPGTDLTKLGTAADVPVGEHLQTLLDRGYKPEQIRVYSTNMPGRGKYLSPNLEELNLHIANMDYTSRATDNSLPTANGNFDAAGHRIFDVGHGLDVNQMELDFTDFNTTAYGKKWLHSDIHINPFLKFGLKVMDKATTPIIVRTKWGSRFPSQQGQIMTEPSEILDSKDWEHFKDMLNSDMSAWENLLFMNNNINTSLLKKYTGYELPYNLTKKSWFRR